jgi:predicted nucleic acid-binding protein
VTLIDSNVLIDILSSDPVWLQWSTQQLVERSDFGPLVIDEIIYAEIATGAASQVELDRDLHELDIQFDRMPRQALFAAAKAFQRYRARGGTRHNVLPDFFIGAHAQAAHLPILTRDIRRYRTYFPEVALITPEI